MRWLYRVLNEHSQIKAINKNTCNAYASCLNISPNTLTRIDKLYACNTSTLNRMLIKHKGLSNTFLKCKNI